MPGTSSKSCCGVRRNSAKPTTPATPSTPVTPEEPAAPTLAEVFNDINATDWFYSAAVWAYNNGLMIGVTDNTWSPNRATTGAMAVVVLSRLQGVDLSQYSSHEVPPAIEAGQWYTNAAIWAYESGILQGVEFPGNDSIDRADLAVMLVNYMKFHGFDCSQPETPVEFTDADQMTQVQNDAFQILYAMGIFKGVGNNTMNAAGATSRAHLAVLTQRLDSYMTENPVT